MSDKSDTIHVGPSRIDENIYEDDGFFSDVTTNGSLSKSLRAMNKYVKRNLLYEDAEDDDKRDHAYFSKESTPKESVTKYGSESNESFERKYLSQDLNFLKNRNVITPENIIQKYDIPKHDLIIVKLEQTGAKSTENLEKNEVIEATKNLILSESNIQSCTSLLNGNLIINGEQNTLKEIKLATSLNTSCDKNVISITENKGAPALIETNTENSVKSISTPDMYETDTKAKLRVARELFFSDNSDIKPSVTSRTTEIMLNGIKKSEPQHKNQRQTIYEPSSSPINYNNSEVILRDKGNRKPSENRHTVHGLSEWSNRTNIYPDVYAPLPYKSPRRYVESDVNIHYRCPVRRDPLPLVPERELARQQAEHMKRLYREQKRTKYLQDLDIDPSDIDAFDASIKELQDMQNRRHQDNFTPSQKAIVPLNRYDDADKVMAKALYTFNGLTPRELSFKKGDLINVRRQIDANWYEGELHGRVGLFPYNYVEVLKGDIVHSPKKPTTIEGRARAKFDFTAQTNLELPLKKGEIVVLTRRIDHNWWEGKNGNKTGIFPDSYVQVLQTPSQSKPEPTPTVNSNKPVVSPASHGLMNGSARSSMGPHSYTPQINSPALSNAPSATEPLPVPGSRSKGAVSPGDRGYGPPVPGLDLNNREPLYVDTNAEAVPYRAMYKYRPQNPDELELNEGDTVYVLEKCDDGWYVGSSQRTGRFGTFPGNYVERI